MLFPIIDSKEWGDKYNIKVRHGECLSCGKSITANIPFAEDSLRGFTSSVCCNVSETLVVFVDTSEEDKEFWNNLSKHNNNL